MAAVDAAYSPPFRRCTVTRSEQWPALDFAAWYDVGETVRLWTQIVGKIRLGQLPWTNHSWHVPLYLTGRGLTTLTMPYDDRIFQIDFDFVDHRLEIRTADGAARTLALRPQTVADFYTAVMGALREIGMDVRIDETPSEIEQPIRFSEDRTHAAYDAELVGRFWRIMLQTERVLQRFRADFIGKCSPIHFFWGGFDLAVTRFSGRTAPLHPGGVPNMPDWVAQEAYSHEVSSAGFWTGGGPHEFPLFYSYTYPEPAGMAAVELPVAGAFYSDALREFVLPYDAVRATPSPDATLLAFLQSTYDAGADLGGWDRAQLERPAGWKPNG
jgi:hypothetical protein